LGRNAEIVAKTNAIVLANVRIACHLFQGISNRSRAFLFRQKSSRPNPVDQVQRNISDYGNAKLHKSLQSISKNKI
jgi:hypothetical protein